MPTLEKTILFTPVRDGVTIPVHGELTCYQTGAGTNLGFTYVDENGLKNVTYWLNQAEVESLAERFAKF
jgi:hypothetical protein